MKSEIGIKKGVVNSGVLITAARAENRIYKQVLTMLNSHAVRSFKRYIPNCKQTGTGHHAWPLNKRLKKQYLKFSI